MMESSQSYVPAAGHARLTALYDPVLGATMRERAFRGRLIAALLRSGAPERVLDLGTGTGSLAIAIASAVPEAQITGLDPDPEALARARGKADGTHAIAIEWVQGRSQELPFEDAAFDAVSCSLMLHHLESPDKRLALAECLRVLRPGGSLHVADWGAAQDPLMWLAFLGIRLLDGFARTSEHAHGMLPGTIAEAGFEAVRVHDRLRTCWGTLELISAVAPA